MPNQTEEKKESISFNPSILGLRADDGQPHLLGSRCSACGKVFFPQQPLCTECVREGTLNEYPLSDRGKIYSFTIVERESLAPKGFKVPYAYGYVNLPEKVRVLSKIIGWTPESLKIDADVELVLEEIRVNPEGQKVVGFRFRII
jgi:uncharacterized OB-fold protein